MTTFDHETQELAARPIRGAAADPLPTLANLGGRPPPRALARAGQAPAAMLAVSLNVWVRRAAPLSTYLIPVGSLVLAPDCLPFWKDHWTR
eukprot:1756809-Pyramimonas_sp.AAC.1